VEPQAHFNCSLIFVGKYRGKAKAFLPAPIDSSSPILLNVYRIQSIERGTQWARSSLFLLAPIRSQSFSEPGKCCSKGRGIYIYDLDGDTGKMDLIRVVEGVRNPSYLAFSPGNKGLYAVNELKQCEGSDSGALSSFSFNKERVDLEFMNMRHTRGTDPCHVAIDRRGRFAAVANFMSGSVAIFPIWPTAVREASASYSSGSSIEPLRQGGPLAHSIKFDP